MIAIWRTKNCPMKKPLNGLSDEKIDLKTLPCPNRGSLELQLEISGLMNTQAMPWAFQDLLVTKENVVG